MAQRGDVHKTTRFRGPTEITLRGAGSSGNDPLVKGSGADVGLRIAIPTTQTANSFTIEKPEGTVVFSIDATGTPSALLGASKAPAPATATASGVEGTITWDEDFLYVCVAADTWKRVAIDTW
jgi:hypothetical protein